jgi:hypothetical protein
MRALIARRLLPTAVCAALVFGPAGTAIAVSPDQGTARGGESVSRLVREAGKVRDSGSELASLTGVLADVLVTADGRGMNPQAAAVHANAVREALDAARKETAGQPATTGDPLTGLLDGVQDALGGLTQGLTSVLGQVTGLLGSLLGVVTGLLGGVGSS